MDEAKQLAIHSEQLGSNERMKMHPYDKTIVQKLVDEYDVSAVVLELWAILSKYRPAIHAPEEVKDRFNNALNALWSSVDLIQEVGR